MTFVVHFKLPLQKPGPGTVPEFLDESYRYRMRNKAFNGTYQHSLFIGPILSCVFAAARRGGTIAMENASIPEESLI